MHLGETSPAFQAAMRGRLWGGSGAQAQLSKRILGFGTVESTLLTPPSVKDGVSVEQHHLLVTHEGVVGDSHSGPAVVGGHDDVLRYLADIPKGAPKVSDRQLSIVSKDDCWFIAGGMQLVNGDELPSLMGANLYVSGMGPDFSTIGAGVAVVYAPEGKPRGLCLRLNGENLPCGGPHAAITAYYGRQFPPERQFRKAAEGHRGIVASVLTPGPPAPGAEVQAAEVHPGDIVAFFM